MKWIRKLLPWVGVSIIAAVVIVYVVRHSGNQDQLWSHDTKSSVNIPTGIIPAVSTQGELPAESDFQLAAETASLRLYADPHTGHFKVEDKRDGHMLRSYPNPDDWPQETISGPWRSHLRSPFMLETIDLTLKATKSEVKVSSLLSLNGGISEWKKIDGGFAVTFVMPSIEMVIPVEVRLKDDYVETKVIDRNIQEGKDSLLNMKLYPFLGAVHPGGQDGYVLLPDGSGALYRFKDNVWNDRSIYREPIYGNDIAFNSVRSNRQTITMPVFGIKSGDSAFVAIANEGEEFGYMYAAPSGVYSKYIWAAVEHNYRLQYYQPTSQYKSKGFLAYSKIKFSGDRSVRYYVLTRDKSDYSGMAAKYREYLMKDQGLKPIAEGRKNVPLFLGIIGGDREKGSLRDRYITGTTTVEAKTIVDRLHEQGIEDLVIDYIGWQTNGASTNGFGVSTDGHLGGNEGMKSFAAFAKAKGDTVLLDAEYNLNNDGKSFKPNIQGLQNQAGTVLTFQNFYSNDKTTLVSPLFELSKIKEIMGNFSALGVSGLRLGGTGQMVFSDYNNRYGADRIQAASIQNEMLVTVKNALQKAAIAKGNAYALKNVDYVQSLPNDYSYDLFMDEAVPFAQMALHGLIPYTLNWGNSSDEYRKDLLRTIEYGAIPSFLVMNAKTESMKRSYSIWQYSLNYDEWEPEIKQQYKRFNAALGDVQDQFIVSNRTVMPNVKETTYAKGRRIIVNYNREPVTVEGRPVPGQDFIVVEGGSGR